MRNPFTSFQLALGRQPYLTRKGIDTKWFGIYVHHIDSPDPGELFHDHPWNFVSVVLRGGYAERFGSCWDGGTSRSLLAVVSKPRFWGRWSVHQIPKNVCHRIIGVKPGTKTLIFRGPKNREWGFYTADGWRDARFYEEPERALTKVPV